MIIDYNKIKGFETYYACSYEVNRKRNVLKPNHVCAPTKLVCLSYKEIKNQGINIKNCYDKLIRNDDDLYLLKLNKYNEPTATIVPRYYLRLFDNEQECKECYKKLIEDAIKITEEKKEKTINEFDEYLNKLKKMV